MSFYWLSDAQWSILQPFLPVPRRGPRRRNDRRLISGMVHRVKYGGRWCDLPSVYGPYITVYRYYRLLCKVGTWDLLLEKVSAAHDRQPEVLCLDSTYSDAHRLASGGKGGSLSMALDGHAQGVPAKTIL